MARDYPQKVDNEQIDKDVFGKKTSRKDTSEPGVPFLATYRPERKELGKLMKNLQLVLYSDSEAGRCFLPAPIVSYRSAKKIKDYIVRSHLYPIERKLGRP